MIMDNYLFRQRLSLYRIILTEAVTIEQLAEFFHVSVRTIYNDIPYIQELGFLYGVKILLKENIFTYSIIDTIPIF